MSRFLAVFLCALAASEAHADEGELNMTLRPSVTVLARHGRANLGFGGAVRVGYGISYWLDAEAVIDCDHLAGLEEPTTTPQVPGAEAILQYDATRCALAPALALRLGPLTSQFHAIVGLGLGYRIEVHTERKLGVGSTLVDQQDASSLHQLAVYPRASVEYRLTESFSVGLFVSAALVLGVGGSPELDLSTGVALMGYLYP